MAGEEEASIDRVLELADRFRESRGREALDIAREMKKAVREIPRKRSKPAGKSSAKASRKGKGGS